MKTSITTVLSLAALLGLAVSSAFAASLTEKQQAVIREEVARAMQNFVAACERADLAGTLAFMADVPEFRYADPEGKLLDYPAAKQGLTEWFEGCSAQRVLTQRQEILVLGPDAALVAWQGALELVLKNGTVLRADPYNATFLFKQFGGAWKIAYQHESGPPPQPVKPAVAPANAPTDTTTTVLRMLDDYFAAVNARDPAKFLGFFVGTEDLTVFEDNDLRLSRKDFVAFIDGFFKDVSQIQATWEQRTVNELAPNVAAVTGTFKVNAKDAKGAPMAFRNAFTFVLVKQGERWLVNHVHESSLPVESAPTATTPDLAAMEAAIRGVDAAWAKAIASKSIDQTLACYDPEAVTAGSAMFPARGLPAFRENWAKLFARPDFALTWKTDKVIVTESATVAYSAGTWSMSGPNENGPYLAVWRKQADGQWKVLIDAGWRAAEAKTATQQSAAAPAPAAAGTGVTPSPAQPERKIRLTDAPLDRRLSYTTWRTDFYICTGIAYAKSLGHTVEDFAAFVASQHDIGTTSADGLTKFAQLLYFGLTNYSKGQVIVTAESDTAITMQFNRAYRAYFEKGPVLGVTMDEFERCFWGHVEIMAKRNGFGFAYRIEGDNVTFAISLGK